MRRAGALEHGNADPPAYPPATGAQQPAQGTARLMLVAAEDDSFFRPVELHWEHMTEEDLTEQEVLERQGLVRRQARQPRSIQVIVAPENLPLLR